MSDTFHEPTYRHFFVSYSFTSGESFSGMGNSAVVRDRGITSQDDVKDVQAELEGSLMMQGVGDPRVILLGWREYDAE